MEGTQVEFTEDPQVFEKVILAKKEKETHKTQHWKLELRGIVRVQNEKELLDP